MAHFLITGGCGFIGSHLADRLLEGGHAVTILDDLSTGRLENRPPDARLIVGDVADPEAVREAAEGVDGIFHLAAVASVERSRAFWAETHRTNLLGTVTVMEAARAQDGRPALPVVYASSAAVYGDNPDVPLKETAPPRPLSAYGVDKLGCELHGRIAWEQHGIPTTGLRFFNVYGPRQDPRSPYSGVISIFARRVLDGAEATIHGDGLQTRDFVFVGDVVRALLAAMGRQAGGAAVHNVCTGRQTSILTLLEALEALCGRTVPRRFAPARPGDVRASVGDPSGARAALGVTCPVGLLEGLGATLRGLSP